MEKNDAEKLVHAFLADDRMDDVAAYLLHDRIFKVAPEAELNASSVATFESMASGKTCTAGGCST